MEVSPDALPPVCRVMDYGKLRYQAKKKQVHVSKAVVKEIKIRPGISDNDLNVKIDSILRLLPKNKVKVIIYFKGREITHPELGARLLRRIIELSSDIGVIDTPPMVSNKQMFMVLAPK